MAVIWHDLRASDSAAMADIVRDALVANCGHDDTVEYLVAARDAQDAQAGLDSHSTRRPRG